MSLTATANNHVHCISVISEPVRVLRPNTILETGSNGMEAPTRLVFWDTTGTGNATTITRGLAMAGPYIFEWQEKELYLFPTDYASSLARKAGLKWGSSTPTPASTSNLPQETNPAAPPPASPPSTGLSTGAKAGIAVGAVGALVIGAVIIWMCLLNRRKKRDQATRVAEIEGKPTAEMADQDEEHAGRRWFLGGVKRQGFGRIM
jgi:hypothetical protein